ncbi:MAG: LysR family transcriptional regulator [Steroidobacteraceae bacterium]|nr:LysR family transcriptional regulator [Steroidobacteraceae bacterium]
MTAPRISLEQWRALVAVVEAGGYAQAAEQIHKTQSTVSYAVQKIEQQLDVKLFEIRGRKAELTPAGQVLYRRAQLLLERAASLERGAASFAAGWEPQVSLAVEVLFPTWVALRSLDRFAKERPEIRVQLYETVLGGTDEALQERRVDFAIVDSIPQGFFGTALMRARLIPAANPDHPLHKLGRPVTPDDLREHRQLIIRDTAQQQKRDSGGWQRAEQRWTVSHKATQIAAACMGLGFAWFAAETIQRELEAGHLKELPMQEGGERFGELYLVFADPENPGKAASRLAAILQEDVGKLCREAKDQRTGS